MTTHPPAPATATDFLRAAITAGQFVPNQRLVEPELAEQFGTSRAAVRDALIALAAEGLVERIQNRGARVRAVPLAEAIEITEVRMALEGLCAAKAAKRSTCEDRQALHNIGEQMRTAVASADPVTYADLDRELHTSILTISGQHTARAVLERLNRQQVHHQFRLAMRPGQPRDSLPQHLIIIKSVCAGDAQASEAAMRAHLSSVVSALPDTAPASALFALDLGLLQPCRSGELNRV